MFRGVLAASLVFVWLALSGLEHLSDIDFSSYRQTRKTAKADLVVPGEANEIADGVKLIASKIQSHPPSTFHPSTCASLQCLRKENIFSKERSKIYKLHGIFLI